MKDAENIVLLNICLDGFSSSESSVLSLYFYSNSLNFQFLQKHWKYGRRMDGWVQRDLRIKNINRMYITLIATQEENYLLECMEESML